MAGVMFVPRACYDSPDWKNLYMGVPESVFAPLPTGGVGSLIGGAVAAGCR